MRQLFRAQKKSRKDFLSPALCGRIGEIIPDPAAWPMPPPLLRPVQVLPV